MTYSIRESSPQDKDLISDFNKELEDHGINFRLPNSTSANTSLDDFIFERQFVLTEDKKKIKAGYTLKCQWFKINDDLTQIGYYYNPVTAGLYNKKYNICGVLLLNNALKKYPNLFCLGMGGHSESLPKLLKVLNWNLQTIPFFFKVFNSQNFLKNIRYLKNTKAKLLLNTILINLGLGWLAIKFFFKFKPLFSIKLKKQPHLEAQDMNNFDEDLNSLWESTKKFYSFIGVRNSQYLKKLYSDKKFIKLKFIENDKVVGWSISLCTKLDNHKYFGYMKLGSIVDCLSLKGYETSIVRETSKILENKGVDLIVTNQSHIYWKNALKTNSFINGPSNFIFASSKDLSAKLADNKNLAKHIHLTRGDGDGPINL